MSSPEGTLLPELHLPTLPPAGPRPGSSSCTLPPLWVAAAPAPSLGSSSSNSSNTNSRGLFVAGVVMAPGPQWCDDDVSPTGNNPTFRLDLFAYIAIRTFLLSDDVNVEAVTFSLCISLVSPHIAS